MELGGRNVQCSQHNNICSVNTSMSEPEHSINGQLLGLAYKVMAEKQMKF